MEAQLKGMIFAVVLIIFGISVLPVVFTTLGEASWILNFSGTEYDLVWVGYIVGLLFAVSLVGIGVATIAQSFKR